MLKTEMRNEASWHIDKMDTLSMVSLINKENMNAVLAVEKAQADIAKVCDKTAECIEKGGRLFYIGCGTSGRLGVLDAAECPPTYGVPKDQVVGIIAGGDKSLRQASEASEDSAENGKADIAAYRLCDKDIVIGISAAGGAAYVLGAMEYAREKGALTVSLTNNANRPIEALADIVIHPDTGAEVVTGSTRMKAGSSQKMVLNMISTAVMIKQGHVYENMMINLRPSNIKLRDRMIRIVCEITKLAYEDAENLLEHNDFVIRKAIEVFEK